MKLIKLTKGKFAKVDDEDFEMVNKFKWYSVKDKHSYRAFSCMKINNQWKTVYLHRFIMNFPEGKQVDHINIDPLDNRRSNLRVCSQSENQHNRTKQRNNTSGFKGVYWSAETKKWRAKIRINNNLINIGYFADKVDAAKAYDKAALELHSSFAKLNFEKQLINN